MKLLKVVLSIVMLLAVALPAVAATPHQANLAWTDASNPSGTAYNIYRAVGTCPASYPSIPTGDKPINSSPVSTKTYSDTTVSAATTYCYFVTAVLNSLESLPSSPAQGAIPLAGPTNATYNSGVVAWTASTDATANPSLTYSVYRGPGTCSASTVLGKVSSGITGTSYTDTGAVIGTTYCYGVSASLNGVETDKTATEVTGVAPVAPITAITITVQ